jgi:hypothetical protein
MEAPQRCKFRHNVKNKTLEQAVKGVQNLVSLSCLPLHIAVAIPSATEAMSKSFENSWATWGRRGGIDLK